MVLKLLLFPLPASTNLPLPCKRVKLIEDTLTFNHLQFQNTCMYLLKTVGLVWLRHLPHFNRHVILPYYVIEVILNIHSRYILARAHTHIYRSFQGYNVTYESRLTNDLKLVPKDSLMKIIHFNMLL